MGKIDAHLHLSFEPVSSQNGMVVSTYTEMVFPLGCWLDQQKEAGRLSKAAYEKICRGNAARIFGL